MDRPPRLTLPFAFLFYPSGYLDAGEGEGPAALHGDEPVLVGTEVYGDGRGKHVISVQAGRHSH